MILFRKVQLRRDCVEMKLFWWQSCFVVRQAGLRETGLTHSRTNRIIAGLPVVKAQKSKKLGTARSSSYTYELICVGLQS